MEAMIVLGLLVAGLTLAARAGRKQRAGNPDGNGTMLRPRPSHVAVRNKRVWQREMARNVPPMPKDMTVRGTAHVIDGDTVSIRGVKIRLAGIDAPELDQPWGQKAKRAMVTLCKGQVITARLDGERSIDRLVGTCFLPDGRDIGADLVRQGLALDLPDFSRGKYRDLEPEGARRKLARGALGHASNKRRIG